MSRAESAAFADGAESGGNGPARGPAAGADGAERRGILFVLSSPSGAGKSTLARRLLDSDKSFWLSVSATTRPMRPGEVDGREYHFVAGERFERMVEGGEMLEWATIFGNRYGTPDGPIREALAAGRDVLLDVDWQGAQQLRSSDLGHAVVTVFVLPPSIAALEARLKSRAQDSDEVIERRMSKSQGEISHWAEYDYVLVNDDLDLCFARIVAIVEAERLRWMRQRWVLRFVERLNREFEARMGRGED